MTFTSRRVLAFAAFVSASAGCATGVPTGGDSPPPTPDAASDTSLQPDVPITPESGTDTPLPDVSDEEPQDAGPDTPSEDAPDPSDAECADGTTGPGCSSCATGYHLCGTDCVPDGPNDPATGCAKTCGAACTANSHEIASCSDAGECETTCATGYEGANCSACESGFLACGADCVSACSACTSSPYACAGTCVASCRSDCDDAIICDDTCVTSCGSCTGQLANCTATNTCVEACSDCQGQCIDCPPGQHACTSTCHPDAVDDIAHGCKYTCDDLPCNVPANGAAVCVSGTCDITCNTAGGFQVSQNGTECVCDTANGFVEDPALHVCRCASGWKNCNDVCVNAAEPVNGCSAASCDPCVWPAHAMGITCTGPGGTCGFICDSAHGYVTSSDGTACVCPTGQIESNGQCVCPSGTKLCNGSCVSSTSPANGCAGASCAACVQPAHALGTNCSGPGGTCAFTCDSAHGYVVSGSSCVCPANMVDNGTMCVCAAGFKDCSGTCTSITPQSGCSGVSCLACTEPAHSTANCSGVGATCDFACDASGHWVRNGAVCTCDAAGFWVESAGQCIRDPATHRVSSGGTCVCDTAGHWVESGGTCTCAPGYAESGGSCISTCPGTLYGSSCYWYVGTAATFAAAEASCAAQSGHLASVADSAENTYVNSLAAADLWFGLQDTATINTSIAADDCNDNVWLNEAGGTWTGTNNEYDDLTPTCESWDSYEDMVGLTVTTGSMFVFNTVRSNYDSILGLYARGTSSGYLGCIGSSIECDDDDAGSSRAIITRYLAAGSYTLIIDGYDGASGTYVLDVRRFQFTDGSAHAWANWNTREPNNSGANERCAQMIHASGLWNDLSCATALPYVCERPM